LVGGFVAVWKDQDTDIIMGRLFRADGTPITGDIPISTASHPLTSNPYVAVGPEGSFVVAWNDREEVAADDEVWAREFTRTGVPVGSPFLVEGATDAFVGGVAMVARIFVTAWSAPDADINGVWARRYTRGVVFADGFEDGTTAYW
jgi:hypothetical protein